MSLINMNNVIYLPKTGIFNQMLYHKPGSIIIHPETIQFKPSIMSGGMLSTAEEFSFQINLIEKMIRSKERYMGIPGMKSLTIVMKNGEKFKFIATLACGENLHSIPDIIKGNI